MACARMCTGISTDIMGFHTLMCLLTRGSLLPLIVMLVLTTSALAQVVYLPMQTFPVPDLQSWGGGDWADTDGDCQNTRQEVLIEESKIVIGFTKDPIECNVVAGEWHDPYTGNIYKNPEQMEIDHVVSLGEAHESGGYAWSSERKRSYVNSLYDPNHLIAVSADTHRKKRGRDPAEWLPEKEDYQAEYARIWVGIKNTWGLTADPDELAVLQGLLGKTAVLPQEAPEMHCAAVGVSDPSAIQSTNDILCNPQAASSAGTQVDLQGFNQWKELWQEQIEGRVKSR